MKLRRQYNILYISRPLKKTLVVSYRSRVHPTHKNSGQYEKKNQEIPVRARIEHDTI